MLQMLESEGIRQYVEPDTVQRELSEVTGLSADELDHAAHELIRRTASDPTSFPVSSGPLRTATASPPLPDHSRRPPYYEHLGGYSFDELQDYNRHSPVEETSLVHQQLPPPVGASASAAGGWGRSSTAAAAAFRAGALRTRAYRSDEFSTNDYDSDYAGPIYTTSV